MFNLKWGLIAAAAALVISVLLGIIFDVRPFYIFLRALIFSAVFFGIGFSVRMVINNFLPELFYLEEEPVIHENNPQTGRRVDITLDSEYAVPEMYKNGDPNELGNIQDLVSGAFKPRASAGSSSERLGKSPFTELGSIDGKRDNDYNEAGDSWDAFEPETPVFPSARPSVSAAPEKQVFTPSFGDDITGLGGLADLDAMATAFSGGGESRLTTSQVPAAGLDMLDSIDDLFDDAPMAKPVSRGGKKPQQLDGNFDPKELAQSIRTVLLKEK